MTAALRRELAAARLAIESGQVLRDGLLTRIDLLRVQLDERDDRLQRIAALHTETEDGYGVLVCAPSDCDLPCETGRIARDESPTDDWQWGVSVNGKDPAFAFEDEASARGWATHVVPGVIVRRRRRTYPGQWEPAP